MKLFLKRIIIILIAIAFSCTILLSFLFIQDNFKTLDNPVDIYIEKGESLESISTKLKDLNIIKNKRLFEIYGRVKKQVPNIKFGKHQLNTNMNYSEIYNTLAIPSLDTTNLIKITIPEGYTVEQIADVLELNYLGDKEEFLELCKIGDFEYDFLSTIPMDLPQDCYRLEGFLYPETYFFDKNMSTYDIVDTFLKSFNQAISKYEDELANSQYSIYEIVNLASIVERESKAGKERPIIAGVFINRLNKNIKLESCATVEYVLKTRKRVLTNEDISIDSPHNTYLYQGLPITPISNPGESSLYASINPTSTEYLFFVSKKGTDEHAFAKTHQEHLKNVRLYRD